ncbi:MAG: hypothetical protein H6702_09050 [Myxococcales bacterium]|nr:hypothetical protein [Myxococcales bacterium]
MHLRTAVSTALLCLACTPTGSPTQAPKSAAPGSAAPVSAAAPASAAPASAAPASAAAEETRRGVKPHYVPCDPAHPELPCTPEPTLAPPSAAPAPAND